MIGKKVYSKFYGEGVVKRRYFDNDYSNDGYFAVEFKRSFAQGHSCGGFCKEEHGRWCKILSYSEACKCYRYPKTSRLQELRAYVDEIVYLLEGDVVEWD